MTIQQQLQHKIDTKTKPLGALGVLEQVALKVGLIQQTLTPQIKLPHIVVFAGDHGIAATGLVNPYPQAVTAQMVLNFLQGGAAINVFTQQHQIGLTVVDAGVNYNFTNASTLLNAKVNYGTKNYLDEEALQENEVLQAISKGKEIIANITSKGCNMVGFGEMGIGNTSSAALLMHAIIGCPLEDCVGRGTGANDVQLATKLKTLQQVAALHAITNFSTDGTALLRKVGGFEIAMMVGAYLAAAEAQMIVVVDGFIATAALLVANLMNNKVLHNCIFSHAGDEQGHKKMLEYLQANPLLQLGLRLGEGTGAALAMPLIQSSVLFLNQMASFESAGVSSAAE